VTATWAGRLAPGELRDELVSFAGEIANESKYYWDKYPEPIADFNRLLSGMRSRDVVALPDVRTFADEISGPIVVSSEVLRINPGPRRASDGRRHGEQLKAAGLEFIPDDEGSDYGCVVIEKARLEGVDFRLFDPRGLYPMHDRISFVFLNAPGHPILDNVLVRVHDAEVCKSSNDATVREAAWYLDAPSIHLRYAHEGFLDQLLAWLKYFYIEDLHFWRYEDLPNYDEWSKAFDDLVPGIGLEKVRHLAVQSHIDLFREEADRWIAAAEKNFAT
jgi:hypothetical protein